VINQLDECVEAGYLRVNDEWWEIYNGGTEYFAGNYIEITENNVITSTLKAGTNIQITDDGTVSASGAEIVQTVTSGTQLATIDGTSIYAPTTTVTQVLTSGTEIGAVNGTKLYAPTGGGSDVTVTPITTTGTNIANIAVNGTTYNLYAPTSGGGGHNYSTTEQVIGTWIDGSTLYERTYDLGSDLTLQDSTWTDTGISTPTNANRCIKAEGVQSDGTSTCIMATVASTNISVQSTKNGGDSVRYVTLQYTKTS
ncbi:hypothetical protein ACR77V_12905, partial [Staphylococcus epidermidis]|uniref:hypothetical protein n=1 Tax=Staphylococcus epidermidis TaxID=1282 RepID=UPI003DA2B249